MNKTQALYTGCLFGAVVVIIPAWAFGFAGGKEMIKNWAVQEDHAHWEANEAGKPIFRWNPHCITGEH